MRREKKRDNLSVIVLQGEFSTDDNRYKFDLKSDGTGEIFYSDFADDSEEFVHQADVKKLAREIAEATGKEISSRLPQSALEAVEIQVITNEIGSEMLEDFFWEQINQTLEDPFFRPIYDESELGAEFGCERGTTTELTTFLELCVLTEREIKDAEDYLIIESETDFNEAGLSDSGYYTERLEELVRIACHYFKPTGFRYDYNDGCYDRLSGYSMSSESTCISLSESARASAREKMLGRLKLREKLTAMNVSPEEIERLTAF